VTTPILLPHTQKPDLTGQVLAGCPLAQGRWQPTRAGVVNSWEWAEETFLFADGWLAFVGANGSGKTLTAGMLITPLLDGDVSQTALSIDGSAAGTLIARHTCGKETKNLSGTWWLEFGFAHASTGAVEHVTCGMWLRSSGGNMQRAFFLSPGRVGEALELLRDRDPADIGDLSAQVAAAGGLHKSPVSPQQGSGALVGR
jgi:hypothetical protein